MADFAVLKTKNLTKSLSCNPLDFGTKLAGMFILLHKCLMQALDCYVTNILL